MKFLLSFFCCFVVLLSHAQRKDDLLLDSILSLKDKKLKTQLLQDFDTNKLPSDSLQKGTFYHELALIHYRKKDYEEAIANAKKAVSFKQVIRITDAYDFQKSLNLLDLSYNKSGNLAMRLQTLSHMIGEEEETKFTRYALRRLVLYHYDIGDYFESIEYAQRIIRSYDVHGDTSYYLKSLIDVINAYAAMKSDDPRILTEIEQHKQLLDDSSELFSSDQKIQYYNSLGLIYRGYGKKEQALDAYQKALQSTTEETYTEDLHSLYVNIGEMYSQLKQNKNALTYYQKVLATTDSLNISAVYNNLGYYHAESLEEEIELHQKALKILEKEMGLNQSDVFPEAVKDALYKEEFLSVLIDLSQAWIQKFEEDNNSEHLEEALKVLYRIDDFISIIRLNSRTKASKLFWIARGVNSYLEAVKVCFLLNRPEAAFYFMEKNKSLYLLEQLNAFQLKRLYKIPRSLLKREEHLAYELSIAKSKLQQASNSQEWQRAYQESFRSYATFRDSLEQQFPDFQRTVLRQELIRLKDFQQFLSKQNAQAVAYITSEDQGYGLWITADEVQLYRLESYSKLKGEIEQFKELCSTLILTQEEIESYTNLGAAIFQSLFPFQNAKQKIASQKLKIIPSGVLYNLPFEALLVDKKPSLKDNFLIQIAEVSYLNSASVTRSLHQAKSSNTHAYLGIAPVEFHSSDFITLNGSETIVKEVASLFDSQLKFREEASRKTFLNLQAEPSILHINTHAGIDQRTQLPWIRMHDSLIALEELYLKNTSHDLVFLDACKTGDGALQKGEGIESLSRAFFHSGSRSVVASRWNANEKATNAISLGFFKELQKGTNKSAALRQAKLHYLETSQLSESLPYFWASLALTGNAESLPEVSHMPYFYWILPILFLVILLIFIRKRKPAKA
jgi:CHAT domain-containing protein/tetratricopeptide (TPR) repeat protein